MKFYIQTSNGLKSPITDTYTKSEIDNKLFSKVDVENGKGLSTNDLTNELLDKLNSLKNYDDTEMTDKINKIEEILKTDDVDLDTLQELINALKNNVANIDDIFGLLNNVSGVANSANSKADSLIDASNKIIPYIEYDRDSLDFKDNKEKSFYGNVEGLGITALNTAYSNQDLLAGVVGNIKSLKAWLTNVDTDKNALIARAEELEAKINTEAANRANAIDNLLNHIDSRYGDKNQADIQRLYNDELPTNPSKGQIFCLIDSSTNEQVYKQWNGIEWIVIPNQEYVNNQIKEELDKGLKTVVFPESTPLPNYIAYHILTNYGTGRYLVTRGIAHTNSMTMVFTAENPYLNNYMWTLFDLKTGDLYRNINLVDLDTLQSANELTYETIVNVKNKAENPAEEILIENNDESGAVRVRNNSVELYSRRGAYLMVEGETIESESSYINEYTYMNKSVYSEGSITEHAEEDLDMSSESDAYLVGTNYLELSSQGTIDIISDNIMLNGNSWNETYNKVEEMYGSYIHYTIDDSISYMKQVPSNAYKFAYLNKLGGMTYESKNLFNPNATPDATGYRSTAVPINDGKGVRVIMSYDTIVETNTAMFQSVSYDIPIGRFNRAKKYYFSFTDIVPSSTNRQRIIIKAYNDANEIIFNIGEMNGGYLQDLTKYNVVWNIPTSITNYGKDLGGATKVRIQLFSNDQKDALTGDYVDYGQIYISELNQFTYYQDTHDSPITSITSNSKNILKIENGNQNSGGNPNITITANEGQLYFTGQVSTTYNFRYPVTLPAGQYTLSLGNTTSNETLNKLIFGFRTNKAYYSYKRISKVNDTYTYTSPDPITDIFIGIQENLITTPVSDLTGFTCYPVVVRGATPATEYIPYYESILTIPETLTSLTDYGCGLPAELTSIGVPKYNYIDFETKQYVRQVARATVDGANISIGNIRLNTPNETTGYYSFSVYNCLTNATLNSVNGNMIQDSILPSYTGWADFNTQKYAQVAIQNTQLRIVINKNKASTIEELKTWLTENPITVLYELGQTIKEDISGLLVNFDETMSVVGNGTLTHNSDGQGAVPSEVEYQLKGGN